MRWLIHTLCKLPIYMKFLFYYRLHLFCHKDFILIDVYYGVIGCLIAIPSGSNSSTLLVGILFVSLLYLYFVVVNLAIFKTYFKKLIYLEELPNDDQLPRYQLTSQDKRIIRSEIIPYIKQNFQRVIVVNTFYEIVGCFFIYRYSTPWPVVISEFAIQRALIGDTSASYPKEIYFILKILCFLFKMLVVNIAVQIIIASYSISKEVQRESWKLRNFLVIVLYIIDISYQFTISFSFVVVSIVVFISSFFIFKRSLSVYIVTSLIVLFLVFNIVLYKLWTVELFSVPTAEFLSQFTIIGSLLYTVGLDYPKSYAYF